MYFLHALVYSHNFTVSPVALSRACGEFIVHQCEFCHRSALIRHVSGEPLMKMWFLFKNVKFNLLLILSFFFAEHVWQVQVQRRGLAEERGIIGNYHLCLTDKSLTLVRTGLPTTLTGEVRMPAVEFLLTTIRR